MPQSERGELKQTIAHGLAWKLLELTGAQGVQFAVALLLARLMTPAEYGTIGLIGIFITIANVFVQSGFATALVQAPEVEAEDYSSVLSICLLIALPVYAMLFLGAPRVSAYYETPVLCPLLRAMGIVLFPGAMIAVQTAYVSRAMAFRRLFEATMFAVLVSGAAAVFLALRGFGVWAMAAQQILYYFFLMFALLVRIAWRPGVCLNVGSVKKLFHFGWKILASGLIDTIWMNVYGLVIGKRYSQAELGAYNRGEQFPKIITSNLSSAIQSVLFPVYARAQSERETLRLMMKRSVQLAAFVIFPMMAGLAGCADSLVRVLLTERWLFCVPYLRVMCLCYAFWPIHVTNLQMINAMGRSDLFLKLEILKKALGIVILILSLRYGVVAMLLLKAADEFLCTLINAAPVGRLIRYGILEQYKDMLPATISALLMGAIVWKLEGILPTTAGLTLVLQILAGSASYLLISLFINRSSICFLRELKKRERKGGEAGKEARA